MDTPAPKPFINKHGVPSERAEALGLSVCKPIKRFIERTMIASSDLTLLTMLPAEALSSFEYPDDVWSAPGEHLRQNIVNCVNQHLADHPGDEQWALHILSFLTERVASTLGRERLRRAVRASEDMCEKNPNSGE